MSLTLIATPIGNPADMTARGRETLAQAEFVIGEEFKEVSRLLKGLGIEGKNLRNLNEHSTDEDVQELTALCSQHQVALVSDAGTPGFCDPGSSLVKACRQKGISVTSVPGPSSLMMLLSLSSERIDRFHFLGFLPRETTDRERALKDLVNAQEATILLDTPYRLEKLVTELAHHLPARKILLGMDLTLPSEEIIEGEPQKLLPKVKGRKAEFVILIYPTLGSSTDSRGVGKRLGRDTHHRRSGRD